jgi:transposase
MEPNELRFVLERKARLRLRRLIADGNTPEKIVKRARIILMTADGRGVMAIMREVGVSKTTVWRWQEYFAKAGVEGLVDGRSKLPGKKPISAAIKLKVVERTVKERRVNATHWSMRTMAKEMGISHTSAQRIWAEHDLKPLLVKSRIPRDIRQNRFLALYGSAARRRSRSLMRHQSIQRPLHPWRSCCDVAPK